MGCCGQKRSEQKRLAAAGANPPAPRTRPEQPRPSAAALRAHLTRNAKLRGR